MNLIVSSNPNETYVEHEIEYTITDINWGNGNGVKVKGLPQSAKFRVPFSIPVSLRGLIASGDRTISKAIAEMGFHHLREKHGTPTFGAKFCRSSVIA